jgi:hypothetical protein
VETGTGKGGEKEGGEGRLVKKKEKEKRTGKIIINCLDNDDNKILFLSQVCGCICA